MIKIIFPFFLFLILCLSSCEPKKDPQDIAYVDENILNVPVGHVGVIIVVDTLQEKMTTDDSIHQNQLDFITKELKYTNDIKDLIENHTIQFLKKNNYQFNLIKNFDQRDFLTSTESNLSINHVNYDNLRSKYNYDNLFYIHVSTGLDEDEEKNNQIIAKTYINVTILDLKKRQVKFRESIGGSKYTDRTIDQLTPSYANAMLSHSVVETIGIIDQNLNH